MTRRFLWGLEVPNDLLGPRFLVKTGCSVTLSGGCRLLRPQMAGALERVDGVRVTSFWRTVEDCLLRAPFSYGLAIADSALRAKGVSRWDLCERLRADCEGRRGYRRAQVIASYADGLSENGGESRFRAFFIAYGFPVPELQVEFRDRSIRARCFASTIFGGSRTGRVSSASSTGRESIPCRMVGIGGRSTHSWQNVSESLI